MEAVDVGAIATTTGAVVTGTGGAGTGVLWTVVCAGAERIILRVVPPGSSAGG